MDAHQTSRFGKIVQHNPTTLTMEHKNKWKNTKLMDKYYVGGVIVIPYPVFGVIINIVSKENISYHVMIGGI